MPDQRDGTRELLRLIADLKEQLRSFEELGLTTQAIPDPDAPPPEASTADTATTLPAISQKPGLPVNVPQMTSSRKKTASGATQETLFGGTRSAPEPSQEESYSDETLAGIQANLGDCVRCKLHPTRTHIVFGEGNPDADLMFVGEGPGAEEDVTGRPFVGRAGQLLDRMIEAMGMKREQVYIANIVKCRPPGNREPELDEVETCQLFLFRQIAAIKPKLVVALGGVASKTLLQTKAPISQLRGRFFDYRQTKLFPTFHPAYLLRSPNMKKQAWEDLKKVRDFLCGHAGGEKT